MMREYIKNRCYVNSTLAMHLAEFHFFLVSDDESTWPTTRVVRRRSFVAISAWVLFALHAIVAYHLLNVH
jgi:hypothetical protein